MHFIFLDTIWQFGQESDSCINQSATAVSVAQNAPSLPQYKAQASSAKYVTKSVSVQLSIQLSSLIIYNLSIEICGLCVSLYGETKSRQRG